MAVGAELTLQQLVPSQHFTKAPPRFTEATLVRELEKRGIGRLYIKGDRGLETNVTKGVEYLQKGCTAGDKDGCDDLRRLGL